MLERLGAIIKGILFLLGLVGLVTLPEDVQEWAKLMGPLAGYVPLDRIEFALYAAIIVFGLWILLPVATPFLAEIRRFFKQHDRRRFSAKPSHETDQLLKDDATDEKLAPKFEVSYDGSPSCRKVIILTDRSQTPPVKWRGMSLRARVEAKGVSSIHSCQAKITKIEIQQDNGRYVDYGFHESFALPWAGQADEFQPITVDKNISMHFGFAVSDENNQSFMIRTELHSLIKPFEFTEPSIYRLTIQVRSDEFPAIPLVVEVFWGGVWNKLRASVVQ